jgi:hypothetical protein
LCVIRRQLLVAANAAEFAEKALHLTERADVLVARAERGIGYQWIVVFKNYGRTRAGSLEIVLQCNICGEQQERPLVVDSLVLAPGEEYTIESPPPFQWASQEAIDGYSAGNGVLGFEAIIRYSDVFGFRYPNQTASGICFLNGKVVIENKQSDEGRGSK